MLGAGLRVLSSVLTLQAQRSELRISPRPVALVLQLPRWRQEPPRPQSGLKDVGPHGEGEGPASIPRA